MEIEASQIKFGGGKVLLFDLLDYLYKTNQNAKVWIESKIIYKEIQQKYNSYFDLQHTTQLATLFRYMKRRENVLFFARFHRLSNVRNHWCIFTISIMPNYFPRGFIT